MIDPTDTVGTMFEHAPTIMAEMAIGRPVALAIVTSVTGSAPRPVGTSMLVTGSGLVLGSLSGGCVESAVVQRATEVLHGADPFTELFGYGDADAWSVGLACGGTVEVLICRIDSATARPALDVWRALADGQVPEHGLSVCLSGRDIGRIDAITLEHGTRRVDDAGSSRLEVHPAAPADFLIYGGVDVAEPLARLARLAGFRVSVIDARPAFAQSLRFPAAHQVTRAQPAEDLRSRPDLPTTMICVLTHEDRFDLPVLAEALRRQARFVGAMGSRSTTAARRAMLVDAGVTEEQLTRLHAPIGLDLGGRSSFEIAMSIMAEVVADRRGGTGSPLRETTGPVHADAADAGAPESVTAMRSRATPGHG